ncbi:MAG: DUF2383 domain-containing protein [Deltaproteobacteria bacterium]|jgi:hypothetical protein
MAKVLEKQQIIRSLNELAQLDIDAWHAYAQAIDQINESEIRERLRIFQEDHYNHILNLSDRVSEFGSEPPEFSMDFIGYVIEGFAAIHSMSGTRGALKAMHSNEQIVNEKYAEVLKKELPTDILSLIEMNYSDEKRHLAYLEEQLKNFT